MFTFQSMTRALRQPTLVIRVPRQPPQSCYTYKRLDGPASFLSPLLSAYTLFLLARFDSFRYYNFPSPSFSIMPELHEVSYSREATIAAFHDFYQFLTKFYLSEDMIDEPPTVGWPSVTNENVHLLGKNDEVTELMRHLPYIADDSLIAPHAECAHWPSLLASHPDDHRKPFDGTDIDGLRILTEDLDWENVTPSAFGISIGHDRFILDTQFGIVHCLDIPIEVKEAAPRKAIRDIPCDCSPDHENCWRCCSAAWTVVDFFEVMKQRYRDLQYLPMNGTRVEEWFDEYEDGDYRPVLRSVRQVYKEHGWPDLSVYNKEDCMEAVEKLIHECFPDEEGW